MSQNNLLLIFIKNPVRGTVKTRLAQTVGDEKAYRIYLKLLHHTMEEAKKVDVPKQVWYSVSIDKDDKLSEQHFQKQVQRGGDLGDRMSYAFELGFRNGARKVVIIGSDCPDISPEIIEKAYEELTDNDLVIGPSEDGGYYLLGMNTFVPELFTGIDWSTESVLQQTYETVKKLSMSIFFLPTLNDIDTKEDLDRSNFGV